MNGSPGEEMTTRSATTPRTWPSVMPWRFSEGRGQAITCRSLGVCVRLASAHDSYALPLHPVNAEQPAVNQADGGRAMSTQPHGWQAHAPHVATNCARREADVRPDGRITAEQAGMAVGMDCGKDAMDRVELGFDLLEVGAGQRRATGHLWLGLKRFLPRPGARAVQRRTAIGDRSPCLCRPWRSTLHH